MSNAPSCCCFAGSTVKTLIRISGLLSFEIVALPPLQAEQAFQRFQEPVPASGARRLLEGNGGLVQELVEQRVAELLNLGSAVWAQVGQASQCALQLGGPHPFHLIAESLEDGHHDQRSIPRPEALHLLAHDALGGGDVAAAPRRGPRCDLLEVVDVVEEHVFQLRHGGLDVPRLAPWRSTTVSSTAGGRSARTQSAARRRCSVRVPERGTRMRSPAARHSTEHRNAAQCSVVGWLW